MYTFCIKEIIVMIYLYLYSLGNTLIRGFCLPSLKSSLDLDNSGQNRDVREILRNLIGCLKDWGQIKTDNHGKSKPRIGVLS